MVKAFADGRPCWISLLPTSGTATVVRPPEGTPGLITGDTVLWVQASGMRMIERVIERAFPHIYAVRYRPVSPGSVRVLKNWLQCTAGPGQLVGVQPGQCTLHLARAQEVPTRIADVVLTVEPLPEAELFRRRAAAGLA